MREAECDFCDFQGKVYLTHYGTTNYNRLMCDDCKERIEQHHRLMNGERNFEVKVFGEKKQIRKDGLVFLKKEIADDYALFVKNDGEQPTLIWKYNNKDELLNFRIYADFDYVLKVEDLEDEVAENIKEIAKKLKISKEETMNNYEKLISLIENRTKGLMLDCKTEG